MVGRLRVLVVAVVCSVTAAARPASANTITWDWTGEIDFTYGLWTGAVELGTPVSLTLEWETDTPNSPNCDPGTGRWLANRGATLTVGDWTYTSHGGGAIELNAPNGVCGLAQSGLEFDLLNWSHPAGSPPVTQILVDLRTYNPLGEDLTAVLGLEAGDMRASVQAPGINSGFRWNGEPSGPVPVPEPATLALMTSGLGAVLARRRRRFRPGD